MKTNIKMRVTPKQSTKIQEICFKNNIGWGFEGKYKDIKHLEQSLLFIYDKNITFAYYDNAYFVNNENKEIDADLFIRTNGTCEENTFNELFEKVSERVNDFQIANKFEPSDKDNNSIDYETLRLSHLVLNSKYEELEQKLKKKNEILKKARIKRKNQREELHKLNLKLQKCISLEEHDLKMKTVLNEKHYLEKENKSLKESSKISCNMLHSQKDKIDRLELNYVVEQSNYKKEIEKIKAVIEYLESKVK